MAFDASSTAEDVVAGIDLTGLKAVVTGGGSGIGLATARALAGAGADVTVAVRSEEQGRTAAGTVGGRWELLDLADLESVRKFADRWSGPLHILVNNAGIMRVPEARTRAGWELQFATNHLGHFALASALHPALAAEEARVVAVTSASHLRAPVDFDDINFEHRRYDPTTAYDQSKTANILFAVEAARRWGPDGITTNAVNPGGVRGHLQRHLSAGELAALDERAAQPGSPGWKTPEQGAATQVYVASAPALAGVSGRYFEDCHEARLNQPGSYTGVAPFAIDPADAARLWEISVDAVRSG